MAVRSTAKGEYAKADIESSTGKRGVIDVHELDLASYASVKRFAENMKELPRIDAVVQNAGTNAAVRIEASRGFTRIRTLAAI
ncbi:hypothetical protein GJ744_004400 [Endocarpon pusillum]|uniref:Uncharacterized protein n=1 Tax=Endocarpon pusillum TaxID=364733 RepID=A0A8H7EA12_9EURO|nr:hypothetical protein GJ744_004400 [Endocarpon pusillum]